MQMLADGMGLVWRAWKTSWKLAATRSPMAAALSPGSALHVISYAIEARLAIACHVVNRASARCMRRVGMPA